jgi:hypothetical protein
MGVSLAALSAAPPLSLFFTFPRIGLEFTGDRPTGYPGITVGCRDEVPVSSARPLTPSSKAGRPTREDRMPPWDFDTKVIVAVGIAAAALVLAAIVDSLQISRF